MQNPLLVKSADLVILREMNASGRTGIPSVTEIQKRHGAYLPHWTRDGGWYAVTFRLWDSLPQQVVESWIFERKNIIKTAEQMKRPLSDYEERRLAHPYSQKVERYLDAGYGLCFMKDPRVATLVQNALFHFNEVRYSLASWCVMPNHVHVVVQPFEGKEITAGTAVPHSELPDILHSWKSFTSKDSQITFSLVIQILLYTLGIVVTGPVGNSTQHSENFEASLGFI